MFIFVLREYYARAGSAYNQAVKDPFTSERRLPGRYLREEAAQFVYAARLQSFADLGAPVTPIAYEPGRDLVGRFLAHVGFPPERIPAAEARNVSLSVKGLVATLAVNRIATLRDRRTDLFAALRRQKGFYAPSRFLFDRASAQAVAPLFAADREALASRWKFAAPGLDLDAVEDEFRLDTREIDEIEATTAPLPAADRSALREAVAALLKRG